jgi:type IV secretion system protein VirB3
MDENRQEVDIHSSLNRPHLILGGERSLVMMTGIIAAVFIFSLHQVWSAVLGILLWFLGQWALAQAAKHDQILSRVGIRSLRYRRFYPSAATPFGRLRKY